jgi:hypothetical protein
MTQNVQGHNSSGILVATGQTKQMIWPSTRHATFDKREQASQLVKSVQKFIETSGQIQNLGFRASLIDNQWYTYLGNSIFTTLQTHEIQDVAHSEFFSKILHYLEPTASSTPVERSYAMAVEAFIHQFSWAWEGNPDGALTDLRKYAAQWQDLLRDSPPIPTGNALAQIDTAYVAQLQSRLERNTRSRVDSNAARYGISQTFMTEYAEWQASNPGLPANNVGGYLRNIISCIDHLKGTCLNKV